MKTIRLLVTEKCTRNCEGCCNKDMKPEGSITIEDLYWYNTPLFLITGGEPLLFPEQLCKLLERTSGDIPVIIYTSIFDAESPFIHQIFQMIEGITFTIHDEQGIEQFLQLQYYLSLMESTHPPQCERLVPRRRVNIFCDVQITKPINFYGWDVKFIEWIKDCPLPANETFLQLDPLWT